MGVYSCASLTLCGSQVYEKIAWRINNVCLHNANQRDSRYGEVCPEAKQSKKSCNTFWKKFHPIVLQVQNTREKQK